MEYFRSVITGKIVTNRDVWSSMDIYGKDYVNECLNSGTIETIEAPSVIDCIKANSMPAAYARYCEIHNCPMGTAKAAVQNMRTDYFRFHNIRNRKHKPKTAEKEAV